MAEISPLRRRMIEDMTVRNLSPATQQSYLSAVSKFSRYFGRCPDRVHGEFVNSRTNASARVGLVRYRHSASVRMSSARAHGRDSATKLCTPPAFCTFAALA
jgi:hypothetical protein